MQITLRKFEKAGSQSRFLVLVDGQAIVYAPRRKGKGLGVTAPGTALWVLSEGSKALREGRIEGQLERGSRLLRPLPRTKKAQEAVVWMGKSLLTAVEIEEALGVADAVSSRREAATEAKTQASQAKAAFAQLTLEQMEAVLATTRQTG